MRRDMYWKFRNCQKMYFIHSQWRTWSKTPLRGLVPLKLITKLNILHSFSKLFRCLLACGCLFRLTRFQKTEITEPRSQPRRAVVAFPLKALFSDECRAGYKLFQFRFTPPVYSIGRTSGKARTEIAHSVCLRCYNPGNNFKKMLKGALEQPINYSCNFEFQMKDRGIIAACKIIDIFYWDFEHISKKGTSVCVTIRNMLWSY